MRHRLTLLLTCSIRSRRWWSAWLVRSCSRDNSPPRGFFVGMRISTSGSVNDRKPRSCNNPLPAGRGVGGGLRDAQIMDTATVGVAQKEDEEQGIDQQDIFYRMISFLTALTLFLFSRVLRADDASFRPVMGKRGESDAAPPGAAASASGATTVAASVSETPKRCARAVRERAGASPRARSAASNTGKRT